MRFPVSRTGGLSDPGQTIQRCLCAFSDGFDDLRWLNGHGFALLRKNPRDDDFRGDFRDGKQKRSVAVLFDLLSGVHLIGLCEFHRIAGQTNLDAADLFVADDIVERDGINDLVIRLERATIQYTLHQTDLQPPTDFFPIFYAFLDLTDVRWQRDVLQYMPKTEMIQPTR